MKWFKGMLTIALAIASMYSVLIAGEDIHKLELAARYVVTFSSMVLVARIAWDEAGGAA